MRSRATRSRLPRSWSGESRIPPKRAISIGLPCFSFTFNFESSKLKVNEKQGNPIEIARLGGILDSPDHDRGNLDRVALLLIHFQLRTLEIARPQRQLAFAAKRVRPPETAVACRADVGAEQGVQACLVGLQRDVAVERNNGA